MFIRLRQRFSNTLGWWSFRHALRFYTTLWIGLPVWFALHFVWLHSELLFVCGTVAVYGFAVLCAVMVVVRSAQSESKTKRTNGITFGIGLVILPCMGAIVSLLPFLV